MIIAIIDMGTNTFNLLVAQTSGEILHESKLPVKLGEGGFTDNWLTPEAMHRAYNAINTHLTTAKSFGASQYYAFATSAVRDASNGHAFVSEITQRFNIDVEVISGDREAELIWKGVNAAVDLGESPAVVVDIGGGSNETIIANSKQIFWLRSFNLGVTRIAESFPISDPITTDELEAIESYMLQTVEPLLLAAANLNPRILAGSSGAFDSFRKILAQKGIIHDTSKFSVEIPVDEYLKIHQFFVASTHAQRLALPGLDPIRVDLIIPASIFVNLLVQKLGIKRMFQSDYALKEGFWEELCNKDKG
ncbi:MAG TPA: phosphatase [Bacteroidales bacterium]|nr:phosphatase [Bacteroidales bacterium]